jgi:hypothetical protein
MANHAIWFEEFPNKFHEVNGRYLVAFHQLFCDGIYGLYPHFQKKLGGTLATYSVGPSHSTTTQAIC